MSPAAVPSIDEVAEDPPSPASVSVPNESEETVTECESNGPLATAVSSPWSNTNDNDTFKPLSNSPEPENVN